MSAYRITTNGIKFRVEYLTYTFFRRRPVWSPMLVYHPTCTMPEEYDTQAEAERALQEYVREETAMLHGWTPVTDPVSVEWKVSE